MAPQMRAIETANIPEISNLFRPLKSPKEMPIKPKTIKITDSTSETFGFFFRKRTFPMSTGMSFEDLKRTLVA
jgi:hypothetical protein